MEIRRFVSDLLQSNTYVIEENGRAIAVDPGRDVLPARGLAVDRILLTHEHYDHISGVNAWKDAFGAPVLCTQACAAAIGDPKRNLARIFDVFCELQTWIRLKEKPDADRTFACSAEETFEDVFRFAWQGHSFRLFALPGHSPGGAGILLDGSHFFSGDSLLPGESVELRLPGGSKRAWEEISLPRLKALPDGITIYPGHFAPFTYQKA